MYVITNLPSYLLLGNQGEKNVTSFEFDLSPWFLEYPTLVPAIYLVRPTETNAESYTAVGVVWEGNKITWTVDAEDTALAGRGKITIVLVETINDIDYIRKSALITSVIKESIYNPGTAPTAISEWMIAAGAKLVELQNTDFTGYTGSQGDIGDTGYTGSQGLQGITGYTGSVGAEGNIGFTGSQGIQGEIGYVGSKGDIGATGVPGTSYYVFIKYAHNEPTSDEDISSTPAEWIGIYTGTRTLPPTDYTQYTWYKFKGETGAQGPQGERITNISVDDYNNVTITMSDGVNYAAGSLGSSIVRVQDVANLPSIGKYGSIYIVANSGKAYTFNEDPFGYIQVGDVETIGIINGGDSNG